MSIYKDYELACKMARNFSRELRRNYTVVLSNPVDGMLDEEESTYEIVQDSYFINNPDEIKCYETKTIRDYDFQPPPLPEFFRHESFQELESIRKYASADDLIRTPPFIRDKKIGRNDFCPCGSGKKFKRCCKK